MAYWTLSSVVSRLGFRGCQLLAGLSLSDRLQFLSFASCDTGSMALLWSDVSIGLAAGALVIGCKVDCPTIIGGEGCGRSQADIYAGNIYVAEISD